MRQLLEYKDTKEHLSSLIFCHQGKVIDVNFQYFMHIYIFVHRYICVYNRYVCVYMCMCVYMYVSVCLHTCSKYWAHFMAHFANQLFKSMICIFSSQWTQICIISFNCCKSSLFLKSMTNQWAISSLFFLFYKKHHSDHFVHKFIYFLTCTHGAYDFGHLCWYFPVLETERENPDRHLLLKENYQFGIILTNAWACGIHDHGSNVMAHKWQPGQVWNWHVHRSWA